MSKKQPLSITHPELSKEWHPTKNKPLTPKDVTLGMGKKVWWVCKKGHEFNQRISHRSRGSGCAFCSGRYATKTNNLLIIYPEIAKEWSKKNGELKPENFTPVSGQKVWWICGEGHEWEASIAKRKSQGCPYCSHQRVGYGNDLQSKYPNIALEWNYSRNKNILPSEIISGGKKKYWWLCKKGHEWQAVTESRINGTGCPFCKNRITGYGNDLETKRPEIAKEWYYKNNGDLKPSDFTEFSGKMVWWKDLYGHTWKTSIRSRSNGNNCPFCSSQSSQYEIFIFSEIEWVFSNVEHRKKIEGQEVDIYIPSIKLCIEIDGSYWHRNRRNNDKKKNIILENLGYSIIRLREKPLRKISENDIIFTFSKDKIETIESLLNYIRINFKQTNVVQSKMDKWLSQKVQQNLEYYNKLLSFLPGPPKEESLEYKFPEISKEWNHNKNGDLKPFHLTPFSKRRIWWICKKGHEYDTVVYNKTKRAYGCPYCSGHRTGYGNDLKSKFPKVAKEWHPTKNDNLLPENIAPFSHKKVWWICKKGHEFDMEIASKTSKENIGCPYCSGKRLGYGNDLYSLYPELMEEWDFNKNTLDPKTLRPHNPRKAWWICPKQHEYLAMIGNRVKGSNCPYCSGNRKK